MAGNKKGEKKMHWWIWLIIYFVGLIIALKLADKDYRRNKKEGDVIDPEAAYFWAIFWPAGIIVLFALWFLSGVPFYWIAKMRNSDR